jgi:hypothetical protein
MTATTTSAHTVTTQTAGEAIYAVELEATSGAVTVFLFADTPLGRTFGFNLLQMLMREPGTRAVARGPRPMAEVAAAFEQRDAVNVIDCR